MMTAITTLVTQKAKGCIFVCVWGGVIGQYVLLWKQKTRVATFEDIQ